MIDDSATDHMYAKIHNRFPVATTSPTNGTAKTITRLKKIVSPAGPGRDQGGWRR